MHSLQNQAKRRKKENHQQKHRGLGERLFVSFLGGSLGSKVDRIKERKARNFCAEGPKFEDKGSKA